MSPATEKKELAAEIIESAKPSTTSSYSDVRARAADALTTLKLPATKTEEYRFTPILRILEKQFQTWPDRSLVASNFSDIQSYLIEGLETHVAVLVNGEFNAQLSRIHEPGLKVGSLTDGVKHQPKDDLLFKQADYAADPFVALNTSSWSDGIYLEVADNTTVAKPVMVLNIVDSTERQVVIHSRLAASIGQGSKVSLICRTVCIGKNAAFSTIVEEIVVKDKARLDYCRVQNEEHETSFNHTNIRQLAESHVNTFTLTMNGKLIRNNLHISIDGERSESHFHGLYLLDGETIVDNHTVVDHRKPNSFSNELYKGVMDGGSKGVFNGKIYVRPDAQKTNAFQSNRNILLSERSTINTKPQLEIWADDVKCSHGCTTGQLDEEALFYLRSRGIPKDQAKAMLLYAFTAETFSFIGNTELRAHINALVARRLNKVI